MPENKSTSKKSTSVSDQGPGGGDLGRASYRAEQARDAVIIFAFGWHPTPAYTDFFEQSMIEIFPPEFIFHSIPPGWMVPQVLTPFSIWVMFGASEPIKTVTVHDADGEHRIDVEQTPDTLAAANQRATWVVGHVVQGGGVGARASTMGIGEEEPGPTWVQGEEDLRLGRGLGGRATTMATGEEDPTTLAVGEENPTTQAVGEEGGPTTLAVGEENTVAVRNSPFGTF